MPVKTLWSILRWLTLWRVIWVWSPASGRSWRSAREAPQKKWSTLRRRSLQVNKGNKKCSIFLICWLLVFSQVLLNTDGGFSPENISIFLSSLVENDLYFFLNIIHKKRKHHPTRDDNVLILVASSSVVMHLLANNSWFVDQPAVRYYKILLMVFSLVTYLPRVA